ncbi:MAG: hypothetical protein IPG42_07900 [Betaproteobacteria bacterium]|nr:hypothetical protein [Betaproteobacteria bacterium]
MKATIVVAHFSVPALITASTFAAAASREPVRTEMFVAYVLWGFLFYAAPHILWTVIAAVGKFSAPVWHSGYIASSIALVAVAAFWLGPGDSSGLPIQWMLYWPLAIVLMAVLPSVVSLLLKRRQVNV